MARILVAEDESDILLLIQRMLQAAGHSVVTSMDGNDATAIALQGGFDLLLLDIMLPGREGLEICREVKTSFGADAPAVILLSALGQQIDVEAGLDAGADDYIIKPFSPRMLIERIDQALYS